MIEAVFITKSQLHDLDNLLHHLLFSNQVGRLANQFQDIGYLAAPLIEDIVGVLRCLEIDDAGWTVNFCVYGLVDDEVG